MAKYLKIIIYSILLTAGALAYINTVSNDFVYDDASVMKNNRHLKDFSNITDIFSKEEYFARSGVAKYKRYGEATYRPVVTVSYFIDFALFGENPAGSHAMNLIYHLIHVLVLYKLLLLITGSKNTSMVSSLVFAVHPIGSEAINAISFREDILCSLFLCLSLFYYIKYLKSNFKVAANLYLSALYYLISCMSKENGFILPVLILFYNHFCYYNFSIKQFRLTAGRFTKTYAIFFITATIFLLIRFIIFDYKSLDDISSSGSSAFTAIIRFLNLILYYFRLILIPDKLAPAYNVGFLENTGYLALSIPFLSGMLFAIYYFKSEKPVLSFCLIWYLATLLPVSGLIYLQHPVAERYLYLPSIGVITFFCLLITDIIKNNRIKIPVVTAIILLFISRSIVQNTVWSDEFSLWDYTVKIAPKNYNALANYAVMLAEKGFVQDSIVYYKKALAIDNRAQSHYNLANTYVQLGLREKAKESYLMSIALDPNYSEAHNNLAKMYGEEGKYEAAIEEVKIALKLNPYNAPAYNNLGVCLNQLKRYREAIDALKKAIQISPGYVNAHFNLASSYFGNGEYDKAEQTMRFVVSVDPDNKSAQDYLQYILEERKNRQLNQEHNSAKPEGSQPANSSELSKYANQISTDKIPVNTIIPNRKIPDSGSDTTSDKINVSGYLEKGDSFMESKNYLEALKMYRTALRHSPDNEQAHLKLADCYIKLGSIQLAKKQINEILRFSPNNGQAKSLLIEIDKSMKK